MDRGYRHRTELVASQKKVQNPFKEAFSYTMRDVTGFPGACAGFHLSSLVLVHNCAVGGSSLMEYFGNLCLLISYALVAMEFPLMVYRPNAICGLLNCSAALSNCLNALSGTPIAWYLISFGYASFSCSYLPTRLFCVPGFVIQLVSAFFESVRVPVRAAPVHIHQD
jgi:hypothetical protein